MSLAKLEYERRDLMPQSTIGRLASVTAIGVLLHSGLESVAETSESAHDVSAGHPFFSLEQRDLDSDRSSFPSMFPGAFPSEKSAGSGDSPLLSRSWPAAEAGALTPRRFDAEQVEPPTGRCRTSQCRTLVIIGAAVAGVGMAVIATGGEGNRNLGTALAVGGAGLITIVLVLD